MSFLKNLEGQIMVRRKILIIGMFDSIHLARWLSQFENEKINFILFPSKKFKYINHDLLKLIRSEKIATYKFARPYFVFTYLGFLDYFFSIILKKIGLNLKLIFLRNIILKNTFDYIHAIELQGAAYLYDLLPKHIQDRSTLIVTNYGSDIQYFQNIPDHQVKIKSIMSKADFYSAECQRDYESALKFGFTGKFLPCIPNAGGFKPEIFDLNVMPSQNRKLIIAKCYGGEFGLGKLVIQALDKFLMDKKNMQVLLYSVTDDILQEAIVLQDQFNGQIQVLKIRDKINRRDFLKYFAAAKIYVGASKSDGISTAFLEALCLGAYPIQTNTSCASDWIDFGFKGSVIEPSFSSILETLDLINKETDLDTKRLHNLSLAQAQLSFDNIKSQAEKFYKVHK